jgi:hypothetical protein
MNRVAMLVLLLCAGCTPYVWGTVTAGPNGETVLSGDAKAKYAVDKQECLNLGKSAEDHRAVWAACMKERGYTVTVAGQ